MPPGGIFLLFRESAASVAARILEGSLALHLTEKFGQYALSR